MEKMKIFQAGVSSGKCLFNKKPASSKRAGSCAQSVQAFHGLLFTQKKLPRMAAGLPTLPHPPAAPSQIV